MGQRGRSQQVPGCSDRDAAVSRGGERRRGGFGVWAAGEPSLARGWSAHTKPLSPRRGKAGRAAPAAGTPARPRSPR